MKEQSLYDRIGGYDGIVAVVSDLLPRLQGDAQLGRFWQHRGDDGLRREKQLLIDFLAHATGGPMYYTGRDMRLSHRGMRISESDWSRFLSHAAATLDTFAVPQPERDQIVGFVVNLKADIVEP